MPIIEGVQVIIYLNLSFLFIYLNAVTLEISSKHGDIGKAIKMRILEEKEKETQFCICRYVSPGFL